jgi:hypothetical protein
MAMSRTRAVNDVPFDSTARARLPGQLDVAIGAGCLKSRRRSRRLAFPRDGPLASIHPDFIDQQRVPRVIRSPLKQAEGQEAAGVELLSRRRLK